jgi:hypothetical protein
MGLVGGLTRVWQTRRSGRDAGDGLESYDGVRALKELVVPYAKRAAWRVLLLIIFL